MASPIGTVTQLASHALRIGWYWGVNRLLDRQAAATGNRPRVAIEKPVPSQGTLLADLTALMRADAAAVGAGSRPPLAPGDGPLADHLQRLGAMIADLPDAVRRRAEADYRTAQSAPDAAGVPEYLRQDFHYQSGGYLTEESARLYDVQVETLFYGSAQLMRRIALDPIRAHVTGRDQRGLALLDVACGTGRLLRDVRLAFPAMRLTGLDLSRTYLAEAERSLGDLRPVTWLAANAEAMPLPDASQDIVTTVFLFHELPGDVRRRVTAEMARVLKPGGLLVLIDSLQMGDKPDWDGLIEAFPQRFHEPYYCHYAIDDLDGMLAAAGLAADETRLAFLAKMLVRRKAGA